MNDFSNNDKEKMSQDIKKETMGKAPKRDTRKVLIPVLIVVIVALLAVTYVLLRNMDDDGTNTDIVIENNEVITSSVDFSVYPELWYDRYAINSDYVGDIVFESGIINLPVVQYIDEDDMNQGYYEYLRADWETMEYDEEGSIFIDPYTYLDSSMNVVIYGHYVYESYDPSKTHKFTPLELLLEEENYEENSIFYLVLEDEVRVYQIAHVYLAQLYSSDGTNYDMLASGMYYMKAEWTESELTYYLEQVSLIEQYDTGVEIEYGDNFVTLQTCVENRDDLREIVVAKQIASFSLSDVTGTTE